MTLYETLGVSKDASDQDIKRAYRSMALKYHPDRNNGDTDAGEKFKEMNSAYEILGSIEKRTQYDAELNGRGQSSFMGEFPGGVHFHGGGGVNVDLQNIFGMMFGAHGGGPGLRVFNGDPHSFFQQQLQKPPPILKTVQISMEQCFTGCSIPIDIERWYMETPNQRSVEKDTICINIPSGIDSNEFIILRDQGNVLSENGCKGDIKVAIEIVNNTPFKRHGLDLYYNNQITLKDALCGFSFEIKHLNGRTLSLTNKANPIVIRPDYKKVVPQMGLVRGGQVGNLVIEFTILFPEQLTNEQMQSLDKIL